MTSAKLQNHVLPFGEMGPENRPKAIAQHPTVDERRELHIHVTGNHDPPESMARPQQVKRSASHGERCLEGVVALRRIREIHVHKGQAIAQDNGVVTCVRLL